MTDSTQPPRVIAYLQLMRLPNVFTAMADVAMGFLFTHSTAAPLWIFALLLISSSALYTAGMVLNDVCDRRQDTLERPSRPIPSGRVRLSTAVWLSIALFVLGILSALAIAVISRHWGPFSASLALVAFIVLYDAHFKHTVGGPLAMGICRMLNVLLGMSVSIAPLSATHWVVASGMGLYVAGITWFATCEATVSRRVQLVGGFLTMIAGIALLFSFNPQMLDTPLVDWFPVPFGLLFVGVVAALIGWRFVGAIVRPEPALIQAAVKTAILSIIVLDAAVVFVVRGVYPAAAIVLLLVPAIILGRWVYST